MLGDDVRLRETVLDELEWNSLVDATELDVMVDDGVVTLVGTVPSLAEKLAAQSAVESLDEVRDVVSCVEVKRVENAGPTDEQLRDVMVHVLTWDALVPERNIELDVLDGWVTLAGTVASDSQRTEAERAIARILGVRGVENRIEVVDPTGTINDVRQAIDDALQRRAKHRSHKIDVIVDEGAVILRGTVESLDQKHAVHEAVAHARGVEVVCDELSIG